jgi:hypothetical protein
VRVPGALTRASCGGGGVGGAAVRRAARVGGLGDGCRGVFKTKRWLWMSGSYKVLLS